jgi:hypothetical protein
MLNVRLHRFEMRRPIFVGEKELNEAHRRVGMIVGACARLEHAIAYLEWQLTAFAWDVENPAVPTADRQTALRAKRGSWDRYAPLDQRLKLVTKAFEAKPVSVRISKDPRLKKMRQQWGSLRERARKLGDKRNEIGHTSLSWHNGNVMRAVGRPWSEQVPVSEAEDETIVSTIGALNNEIGQFTTQLGELLPFADQDQIHTIA